ncbi:unnamed protein product [Allacma fusca]|uniref:Uncharacterized protein n=1 Tax=Allacma fusca TaxID=39272 RepID=A0A8J2NMH8_9HEXA|nr:unnamed protein product [Allacma fusca]
MPHFIKASKRLQDGVDGLNPNRTGVEIELIVEPNSGALLRIAKKLQLITEFQRLPGITAFKNITEAIIPIFWGEEVAEQSEEDISDIKKRLVGPLALIQILQPTVLGFLVFSLVLGIFFRLCNDKSKETLFELDAMKT